MFKKSLLFIPLFNIISISVLASEVEDKLQPLVSANSQQKNSAAKQELMKKVAQLSAFSAEFTQKIVDADGNNIQENYGRLAVAKPNLLYWQINEPNESLIVSDGKALWLYDPFIEQVSVYATDGAIANTPILLLANPDNSIWKDYDVKLLNKNDYLIKTRNENSQVKSLELIFTSNDRQPVILAEFIILDATGQLSRVSLTNVKELHEYKKLFTFTPPSGVEIDDQR
jgi:outer membrane lipoprotein carrier protein